MALICVDCGEEHVEEYTEWWERGELQHLFFGDPILDTPPRRHQFPSVVGPCPVHLERIRFAKGLIAEARLISEGKLPEIVPLCMPAPLHARLTAAAARAWQRLSRRPHITQQATAS